VATGLLPIHQETNYDQHRPRQVLKFLTPRSQRHLFRFESILRPCAAVKFNVLSGRLGNLSPDQENAIDSLSHALIERVLRRQWPC